MVSDLRQEARDSVVQLELMCGISFEDVHVSVRDQWTASVRDRFRELGVDLNNLSEANAAFAGARMLTAVLLSNEPQSGVSTAHMLRYLLNKSEGYKDTGKRRRFRLWLGQKVLPK